MKTLELNQMKELQGGSCNSSFAGAMLSGSSAIIAVALASNPVGWGIAALSLVSMGVSHYNFYEAC